MENKNVTCKILVLEKTSHRKLTKLEIYNWMSCLRIKDGRIQQIKENNIKRDHLENYTLPLIK